LSKSKENEDDPVNLYFLKQTSFQSALIDSGFSKTIPLPHSHLLIE